MKPTSTYDENALLSRLKESDEQAFNVLYEQYWKSLFVVAAKKTKHLSEAEEIVQEIFLDIWNRRKELQIHTSIAAYLSVCVKYKVLTLLAKKNQERRYQRDELRGLQPNGLQNQIIKLGRGSSGAPQNRTSGVDIVKLWNGIGAHGVSLHLGFVQRGPSETSGARETGE